MCKKPLLTVDAVIMCQNGIILIKRSKDPFKDSWALPGGYVEFGEKVENAALREVKEETGLEVELNGILGVYSDPDRDPRGHTVTVCYMAEITGGKLKADTDASDVKCIPRDEILSKELAFDHNLIIKDAFNSINKWT